MTKYAIYHAKDWNLNAALHFDMEGYCPKPSDYELVAVVESDGLGGTFELTNHIDREWWLNSGVTLIKKSRSTSVGDVIVEVRHDRVTFDSQDVWVVAGIGWTETKWGEGLTGKALDRYNRIKERTF